MPELASIYTIANIGKESTPGTSVAANKRLSGLMIEPDIKNDINGYRGTGYKFKTVASLNREWVEAAVSGPITYSEIIYPLASLINAPSPVAGTTDYTWTFTPDSDGADSPATYTIEVGDSTRAQKFTYGLFNGLTLTFSRDGCELTGNIIGQALTDGVALTASPTALPLVPVFPTQVTVFLEDSYAALAGATALTRAVSAEWSMTDRYSPSYFLDGTTTFGVHVETEPTAQMKLKMEADAVGMGLLTAMRAGSTKFMRILGTGGTVGSDNYTLQVDGACKVIGEPSFSDEDGIRCIEWTMDIFHDATWGKATEIVVVNAQSAL